MPVGPGIEQWILPTLRDALIRSGVKEPDMGRVSDLAIVLRGVFEAAGVEYLTTKKDGSQILDSVFAGSVIDFYKQGLTYPPLGYDPTTGAYDAIPAPPPEDDTGGDDSSSGPSGPSPEQLKAQAEYNYNQIQTFSIMLENWGMEITPNLQKLINTAESSNWSSAAFLRHLRGTSEYADRFFGILDNNGLPKMSEAQYIAQEKEYDNIARTYGLNLGSDKTDYLFQHNISVQEYADKAKAESLLRRNPQLYKQFAQTLQREGLAKGGEVSRKDLFEFLMGMGDRKWYDTWNQAQARYAATQGGLDIRGGGGIVEGQYSNISADLIERFSKKGLSASDLATGFEQVAEGFMEYLNMDQSVQLGVRKQDIIKAVFGGPGSQEARLKLQRVAKNFESGLEADIQTQAYATEGGLKTVGGTKGQYAG